MRTFVTLLFVIIWFIHLILGVGAGYAALRLWYGRHHPLIKWVGLYINAFIIDVLSAIVLLFMAKGVVLTWKFTAVMFISTFLGDVVRAPLILYLIRGPSELPPDPAMNHLDEIRKVVKEEIAAGSGKTTVTITGPSATVTEPDAALLKEKPPPIPAKEKAE